MAKRDVLTKILAIVGTALLWFTILAPFLISLVALFGRRRFLFDYLIPAELFPVVLVGGLLLFWAALRARSRQVIIGWGMVIAVGSLVGGQALAVVTGLASGEILPEGWQWALVLASIIVYSLAIILMGVGGLSLLRVLFRTSQSPGGVAEC